MKVLLIPLFFFSLNVSAEYRVYQYLIKNKITTASDQPLGVLKLSTLDPVSYLAYHGGRSLISIDLLRTWICPGNTSKKVICPSPYTEIEEDDLL